MSFTLNLEEETVEQAFPDAPLSVAPDAKLRDVFALMKEHQAGSIMICENDRLVGIFTERDGLRIMAEAGDLDVPISKVMIKDPITLSASDTMGKAVSLMSGGGYRRLPIVDDQGKPTGMLRVDGILHYLVQCFPKTIYNLPPEPHHAMQQREGA